MKFSRALLSMLRDQIRVGDERLAEHIAQQIAAVRDALITADALERERVNAIREMAIERVTAQDQAREHAADTYERRFEELEKTSATHLSSGEYDRRHEQLEIRLTNLENWRSALMGRYAGIAVVGTIAVAVIAGFITHLLS